MPKVVQNSGSGKFRTIHKLPKLIFTSIQLNFGADADAKRTFPTSLWCWFIFYDKFTSYACPKPDIEGGSFLFHLGKRDFLRFQCFRLSGTYLKPSRLRVIWRMWSTLSTRPSSFEVVKLFSRRRATRHASKCSCETPAKLCASTK